MNRVLVCGAAGFLGSHVCELFKCKGWDVIGLDNLTKYELNRTDYDAIAARKHNQAYIERQLGVKFVLGDIRRISTLRDLARGCDYIINCAAQPAMTIALEHPEYDADVNIMGALNILMVARERNIPAALCSTIHVYGNGRNGRLVENGSRFYRNQLFKDQSKCHPPEMNKYFEGYDEEVKLLTGQITPLHVSKYVGELYARAFEESFGCRVFTARLTGIYGPRQFGGEDHGWVANFAIRTLLNRPVRVFGTDKQVRDILYVEDAARAFLDWYENGQVSGVYNIGGGVPCITSIKVCLSILTDITGKLPQVNLEPARPGDLWYFCCDTSKARKAFGWSPKILPHDGIERLIEWINENREIFAIKEKTNV